MNSATGMWMLIMVSAVAAGVSGEAQKDYNQEEHAALCEVLAAAAALFETGRANLKLQAALRQAIFGSVLGDSDLESLKVQIPVKYQNPGRREQWCGRCSYDPENYPGRSIPHDLLCMCTIGEDGAPFTSGEYHSLCGVSGGSWGCKPAEAQSDFVGSGQPWECAHPRRGTFKWGQEILATTWAQVVHPCLSRRDNVTLSDALQRMKALRQLGKLPNWNMNSAHCGDGFDGICVAYGGFCSRRQDSSFPQWFEATEQLAPPDFGEGESNPAKTRTRREVETETSQDGTDHEDHGDEDRLKDATTAKVPRNQVQQHYTIHGKTISNTFEKENGSTILSSLRHLWIAIIN